MAELDVVTGAFGYTGKYIARRLLDQGRRVRTLTGHPDRPDPFGGQVEAAPLDFASPERLAESLRGAATLYNTYWIRFEHGGATFDRAVANSETLFHAAEVAGVRRVVHTSITNPSEDSPLPYFRGKALVERALRLSPLSHAILRPAVIFGPGDILVNNIAWMLRHLPALGIPGSGGYRLQPIFVDDFAALAVEAGQRGESVVVDAVGPEVFSFEDLVRLIAEVVHSRARLVHLPPRLAWLGARLVGLFVRDVVLTRDEVDGLMQGLLVSDASPKGYTCLSDWLRRHADQVGLRYASELARHFR